MKALFKKFWSKCPAWVVGLQVFLVSMSGACKIGLDNSQYLPVELLPFLKAGFALGLVATFLAQFKQKKSNPIYT